MSRVLRVFALAFLALPVLLSAAIREVSFYCPVPAEQSPVIDGVLDDKCWQAATPYTAVYEYFKANPGPGALKNSFRIVYDAKGFYLGIINYEDNIKGLRKVVTNRDNSELWKDDCAEIYIDPDASGIGFRKFVVNAIGSIADSLRIDGAVMRSDWDGNGWQVKTAINADNWVIEAFFPWADLGKTAKPGDVWMFCHVRYAWASGKFVGTTSSTGGNYASTGNFGYLCFSAPGEAIKTDAVAAKLAPKLSPPWCLGIGSVVLFDNGSGVQQRPLAQMVAEEKATIDNEFKGLEIPAKYAAEHKKLLTEYQKLAGEKELTMQVFRSLNQLSDQVKKFRWKVLLENNFNSK